jgi:hypothetical protein
MSPKSNKEYIEERDLINFEFFQFDRFLSRGKFLNDLQKNKLIMKMKDCANNPEGINENMWFRKFTKIMVQNCVKLGS